MPAAPNESQRGPTQPAQQAGRDPAALALPVVRFRTGQPRFEVFYSLREASSAAQASPQDEFFDVRGTALTRAALERGPEQLEARGAPDPAALQERLMTELRAATPQPAPGDPSPEDQQTALDWLGIAPGPEYLLRALALGELLDYSVHGSIPSLHCKQCNWIQRMLWRGSPPCCPG